MICLFLKRLYNKDITQPDNGEQALEIVESLVRSGKIDVIVIDSVAALTPRDEIEGEMGAHHVGKQARLMSQALRKLTGIVAKSKTVIIFINQIRMQIGVMFGNPETTTGGNALKMVWNNGEVQMTVDNTFMGRMHTTSQPDPNIAAPNPLIVICVRTPERIVRGDPTVYWLSA